MEPSSLPELQGGKPGATPGSSGGSSRPVPDPQATVISQRTPLDRAATADTGAQDDLVQILPSQRLGHFDLLQYIGGGGMGRVFRAYDTVLARTVAVKVLSREQAADGDTVARFRNEAQSAARLSHENIVQVYHVGEDDGVPFIVFEFVEGSNIRSLVEQKGPLPLAEAVSYTLQVAEALAHAAACSVVHRDIKPSNVVITASGRVKLIDLGLARVQRLGEPGADLTASGVTLGTFDYISPEQARDPRTADVRSDIYSLGCTLFYMLTGRPPFPEGTVLQKLLQHQEEKPPELRQFREDLPEEVPQLLRRMMAKDPKRRFQTPAELIQSLLLLAGRIGLSPAGPGAPYWAVPRPQKTPFLQRHVPWMAPLALLILLVGVLEYLGSPWGQEPSATQLLVGQPEEPVSAPPDPRSFAPAEPGRPQTSSPVPSGPDAAASPGKKVVEQSVLPPPAGKQKPASEADQPSAKGVAGSPPVDAIPPKTAAAKGPAVASDTASGNSAGAAIPRGAELRPNPAAEGLSLSKPTSSGLPAVSQTAPAQGEISAARGLLPAAIPVPGAPAGTGEKKPGAGILVVDGAVGENHFATLETACSAAAGNDIIELRYSGPREERPIALGNRRLTIRAGKGFQPVVVFRPSEADLERHRAMFALTGSQLTLVDVALELVVPREIPAESWSLFEIRQAELTRLEKCTLTIRNASERQGAYHQEVAFFRVGAVPGSAGAAGDRTAGPQRLSIVLSDCTVRGEAVVLRLQQPRAIQFTWDNGLVATSERFLVADGSQEAPPSGEAIKIELAHLTALVRGGFCQLLQSESAPRQFAVQLDVADSILLAGPDGPLIEQAGVPASDAFRERISWNGDRNFYEGFAVFWSVRHADRESPQETMAFDAWQEHWGPQREILPVAGRVRWSQAPAASRPVHAHAPGDYALESPPAGNPPNPALGAASDGSDAGAELERLPQVPPLSPLKEAPAKPEWPGPWGPASKGSASKG